ncbi:MAG TPA: hypothetical protein VML75_10225 [Kofleriaceae bacterium]|nr:hypothetical protein [Kofleriaceae bacterium]
MRILLLVGLGLLLSCGPRPSSGGAHAPEPATYDALRWVPADASYALVAARLEDLGDAARELASAVLLVGLDDVSALDRGLREELGFSPWRRDDLVGAGIDPDGGAVVFSRGLFPTAVVRVSDEALLRKVIAPLIPARGVSARLHDGIEVFEWRARAFAVAWAFVDGHFAVHPFDPRRERDPLAWLAAMVDDSPRATLGAGDLRDARAFADRLGAPPAAAVAQPGWPRPTARAFPTVLGFGRLDRVRAALGKRFERELGPCAAVLRGESRLFVAAQMDWRAGDGAIGLELAPAAAATLRAWSSAAPPPGVAAFLASAALRLELGFDLAHLGELARHCPLVPGLGRRVAMRLGAGAIAAVHLGLHSIEPSGVPSRAGVFARGQPAFVDALLARVPGREARERGERIGTTEVVVLAVPLLPPLTYRFDGASFTGAVGEGAMASMIEPATGEDPARSSEVMLLHAEIAPARLPHLGAAMDKLAQLVGPGAGHAARRLALQLGDYALGRARLGLDGDLLVLRASMKMR